MAGTAGLKFSNKAALFLSLFNRTIPLGEQNHRFCSWSSVIQNTIVELNIDVSSVNLTKLSTSLWYLKRPPSVAAHNFPSLSSAIQLTAYWLRYLLKRPVCLSSRFMPAKVHNHKFWFLSAVTENTGYY